MEAELGAVIQNPYPLHALFLSTVNSDLGI